VVAMEIAQGLGREGEVVGIHDSWV
jgi:hypothetical protein